MAMKLYTCDVIILGKGPVKGVELWLFGANQAEAKKAAQALFPGATIASVQNLKEKKR